MSYIIGNDNGTSSTYGSFIQVVSTCGSITQNAATFGGATSVKCDDLWETWGDCGGNSTSALTKVYYKSYYRTGYSTKDLMSTWYGYETCSTSTASTITLNTPWSNAEYVKAMVYQVMRTGYRVYDSPNYVNATPLSHRLATIIRDRQAPLIISKNPDRRAILPTRDPAELRARETLRLVVGNEEYRNFLKHGFVNCAGPSGRIYVIRPGHVNVRVWKDGKPFDSLCVDLDSRGKFPPTDSVIARYLMILNQEDELWAKANKSGPNWMSKPLTLPTTSHKSLVEILAELKKETGQPLVASQRRKSLTAEEKQKQKDLNKALLTAMVARDEAAIARQLADTVQRTDAQRLAIAAAGMQQVA